ncbi:hypothetical protein ACI3PL_32130, partial [Lacticaseibacillus paracasei]
KIEAGDTFAEDILAQLPKLNQGLDKSIVTGGVSSIINAAEKFDGKTGNQLLEAALTEEFEAAQ